MMLQYDERTLLKPPSIIINMVGWIISPIIQLSKPNPNSEIEGFVPHL